MNDVTFTDKIGFEEYNSIRTSVGWSEFSERQYKGLVTNTTFIAVACVGGKAVAILRAFSDGYFFSLAELAVHKDYQRRTLGTALMNRFLKYIADTVETGEKTSVMLVSSDGKEPFYEKFGFTKRPFGTHGAGMSMVYIKNENKD